MSIRIIATESYLPEEKIDNKILAKQFLVDPDWITKRCGITARWYAKESIQQMAVKVAKKIIEKKPDLLIDMILVCTTSSSLLMPGISFFVQKEIGATDCFCMDLLAGCAGYLNGIDIAHQYMESGKIQTALLIGVEKLSQYMDHEDINTKILLSDGAGAMLITKTNEEKIYESYLQSDGSNGDLLTVSHDHMIQMKGTQIYRYAVMQGVECIEKVLEKSKKSLEEIKWIIPHQSNLKIIEGMEKRLGTNQKVCWNSQEIGNTFCASIPISIHQMMEKKQLAQGDKVVLTSYGGGLNHGAILIEI